MDVPEIDILLLGDVDVGKSTFLSRLPQAPTNPSDPASSPSNRNSLRTPTTRTTTTITLSKRPYRLHFHTTSSIYSEDRDLDSDSTANLISTLIPTLNPDFPSSLSDSPSNSTPKPKVLILCYDISRPSSLVSAATKWHVLAESRYNRDERSPVILLGLKRDLRRENAQDTGQQQYQQEQRSVMPFEALNTAQELRCDCYCECSALTGELFHDVFEDVARVAAKTLTEEGGRSAPPSCVVM